MHIANQSTESLHATEILLIPQTSNFAISLTLKTRTVTECDFLSPASALAETGNKKKFMFKISTATCVICWYKKSSVIVHYDMH